MDKFGLVTRTRAAWSALSGVPEAFTPGEVRVVITHDIPIAPPGWTGIVALGDACLVLAPEDRVASRVSAVSATCTPDQLPLLDWNMAAEKLGPAALFFGEAGPATDGSVVTMAVTDPRLRDLLSRVPSDDAREAGLADVTSALFVALQQGVVVSACGYTRWPGDLAHVSVLTDPDWRRSGYARRVALAALSDAVHAGLLPQWRARPEESQRLAESLGLTRIGTQLSVRL